MTRDSFYFSYWFLITVIKCVIKYRFDELFPAHFLVVGLYICQLCSLSGFVALVEALMLHHGVLSGSAEIAVFVNMLFALLETPVLRAVRSYAMSL